MEKDIQEVELAFIHDANTEVCKQALFANGAGAVRAMGNTKKMGPVTNCQDRLIALHDVDIIWQPSDLAQHLGRIIRQGNTKPEVEVFRCITEVTFGSCLFQLM